MSEILLKNDGTPFENKRAAEMYRGRLESKDGTICKVIDVEGGFALEVESQKRPKRVPLARRNVLTAPVEDGYVKRFVNDVDDRIQTFQEAGWEIVPKQEIGDRMAGKDTPVGSATTKAVGAGKTAVLMRKRQDWYEQDYAIKQEEVDKSEEGLLRQAAQDRYGKLKINQKNIKGELING